MSYQPAPSKPKAVTPAIITALAALLLLAVITVVVVTHSDSTTGDATGLTGASGASSSAEANGVPSNDETFTYVRPQGFTTQHSEDSVVAYLTNDPSVDRLDSHETIHFTISVIDNPGQSLEEVTAQALDSASSIWENVEIVTPLVADIDGEETTGIAVPELTSGSGILIAYDEVLVMHHRNWFTFTAKYPTASRDEARAAFIEFLNSVRWSS